MTVSREMDLQTLVRIDKLLTEHGLQYLIYGGWGLDIICGAQSRPHGDLDLFCWQHDYSRVRSLLSSHEFEVYEFVGRHLAVKAPFRADIVFLHDPGTGPIIGKASVFEVRMPRRTLCDWSYGMLDEHRLPVGCVELILRLCGYSPKLRPSDRALVEAAVECCDRSLLSEIEPTSIPYDSNVEWVRR